MERSDAPRIDKWLWAVRAFKTRSQATEACRSGKVKIDDQPVKPSREVKPEMIIQIHRGPITQTFKVLGLLKKRVGAKLVDQYLEDITPDVEYQKLELIKSKTSTRPRGTGRPTKKERRDLDTWFGWDD